MPIGIVVTQAWLYQSEIITMVIANLYVVVIEYPMSIPISYMHDKPNNTCILLFIICFIQWLWRISGA